MEKQRLQGQKDLKGGYWHGYCGPKDPHTHSGAALSFGMAWGLWTRPIRQFRQDKTTKLPRWENGRMGSVLLSRVIFYAWFDDERFQLARLGAEHFRRLPRPKARHVTQMDYM